MKYLIPVLLLGGLLAGGCGPAVALAQTPTATETESVTLSDLGIENPGLLPTNPFYFLKEWTRNARRVLTFNPVTKTELELKITNEKAAETKKVEETRPADAEAIAKALENYQTAQERLKNRLEALKETSQNPNVDQILNKLADQTVKHQKIFDEIGQKFESASEVNKAVEKAKEKNEETAAAGALKDSPAKFAAKLESALVASRGGDLKHVQSVELIDRLQEKAPEIIRDSLERLKRDFSERLQEDIKKALEKDGSEKVRTAIEKLPGNAARQSVILEEIKVNAEARVKEVLEKAAERLEKAAAEEKNISEKAKEQIRRSEEIIKKVEAKAKEISSPSRSAIRLLENASQNFKEAETAYNQQKYGEAFGQARSAEVLARNANQLLDEAKTQTADDLKQELAELSAKIERYGQLLREQDYSREKQPKAYALLDEAKKHLGFAEEELRKENREGVKLHISHVLGYLRDLARLLESLASPAVTPVKQISVPVRSAAPAAPTPTSVKLAEPILCTQQYEPVCGENGKTYSNECTAKVAGVIIKYRGECQIPAKETVSPAPEPAAELAKETSQSAAAPTIQEFKLEADDSGFYPSGILTVPKGSKVKIHFIVRTANIYYGGLDFRSSKFKTESIKPGGVTSVEFLADESFEFSSYWPASGVLKSTGKVVVQ